MVPNGINVIALGERDGKWASRLDSTQPVSKAWLNGRARDTINAIGKTLISPHIY